MTLTAEHLNQAIVQNRKIFVYGAGNQGRGFVRALRDRGIEPAGLIDRNHVLQGRSIAGLTVFAPTVLETPDAPTGMFVIIAAYFFEREIARDLEALGFARGTGFLPYSTLRPRDYVVEVSGICNLNCIACPRASRKSADRYTRLMNLDTFQAVIDKIRREDPFVANIQLYQWGEPTLNKFLPDMIRFAHTRNILCTVSSNLNFNADFKGLVTARPECLRISVSGTGKRYAVTHTGGRWEQFLSHVQIVADLRRDLYPEMKIELYHHLYKDEPDTTRKEINDLCARFDFEYHPVPAYLISLDDVLGYCEGRPLPDTACQARQLLLVDLDEGLARAQTEATLDCDALRMVLINADLSVSCCMMFYDPEGNTCAENYLATPIEDISARRMKAPLCVRCRRHGIHRYCGVYAKIGEEKRY